MFKAETSVTRLFAAAAILGGIAFAVPAAAQGAATTLSQPTMRMQQQQGSATDQEAPAADQGATQAAPQGSPAHHEMGVKSPAAVEAHIKSLHDKLKITPAQEEEWAAVAQAMRDNENNSAQLVEQRHASAGTRTAVQDLESYQQILQAHADGLKNVIAAFEGLYNDMPQAQQANADAVFGRYEGNSRAAKAHR